MRDALAGLTTRGRAFLAAGGTALVCAVVLGYPELVRVGALLLLVPLVTAWFLGRSRYRLGVVRTVSRGQVVAGQPARVSLELTNEGRMPTGLLLLEDQIPYVLGSRPRFVVDRTGSRWQRSVGYDVRSEVRGKFTIGPMRVRLSDPFGMVERERGFWATSALTVTPRVTPLPAVPISGVWTGAGDNRPRAFASGSAEDVTVREYRRGDDLRRVHWRSSAHAGELMVRREEQPWQSRATLFLDNRRAAHRGSGAGSSLEHAVSVAASIGVHLARRGFRVRFVTAAGEERGAAWHEHGAASTGVVETAPLLESLAVVAETTQPDIDARWLGEGSHSGLLLAVLGAVSPHDRPALARMRHTATTALAVALDVPAWSGDPRAAGPVATARPATAGGPDAAGWLTGQGWRAVIAGPHDPLATVWEELGTNRRSSPGREPMVETSATAGSPEVAGGGT